MPHDNIFKGFKALKTDGVVIRTVSYPMGKKPVDWEHAPIDANDNKDP